MSTSQTFSVLKAASNSFIPPTQSLSKSFLSSQPEFDQDEWHVVEDPKKKRQTQNNNQQRGNKRRAPRKPRNEKETGNKGASVSNAEMKTEKRLDRQLYSVREKMNKVDETAEKTIPEVQSKQVNEKIQQQYVDDSKSCTSNASTAISDRTKHLDDISSIAKDVKESSSEIVSSLDQDSSESLTSLEVLLNILVQNGESTEMYPIFKKEQDYVGHLDELCGMSDLYGTEALVFKINIMTAVTNMEPEHSKAQEYLDNLLDENYKRMMEEAEMDEELDAFSEAL